MGTGTAHETRMPRTDPDDHVLLTPAAAAAVDRTAMADGIAGHVLMENAGRAVFREILRRFPPRPVAVLCGPGNNGGDGWVVARRLREAGWPVRVLALVPRERLAGDAARAAARYDGPVAPLAPEGLAGAGLVVDALFGAGLSRDLEGPARAVVETATAAGLPVVAVDVPSGVDGATGAVRGAAPRCGLTVTFVRAKPGHLLLPGRLYVGELVVADIGITDDHVRAHDEGLRRLHPALFRHLLRPRTPLDHKYRFGHAVVVGGPPHATGATRMAAEAALRAGCGLVTVACTPEALPVYAARHTAVMTRPWRHGAELDALLADRRVTALLFGPAAGVDDGTRALVPRLLAHGRPTVLDADALTVFRDDPAALFDRLGPHCVLTPHDGEYARLFPFRGDRLSRARRAAETAGAVVLLKGGDTVVAAPDGRAAVMADAPAELATAGSGDVLAGILVGLLARGLPAFEAACAAVWLHAAAAWRAGGPLTAETLLETLLAARAELEREDACRAGLPEGTAASCVDGEEPARSLPR